ncbi:hypothetical protein B0T20DRAFT_390691 [Sordaria brevicollis]|uniref:Uncharacterized protein n=1 Tax=Sordaria brevicollis TaxID=83679 RepID=A0AAE0PIS9_SORBR|nr:hypothetical protein B0T20DRAFT_390691 [Sordaria brevicollis]
MATPRRKRREHKELRRLMETTDEDSGHRTLVPSCPSEVDHPGHPVHYSQGKDRYMVDTPRDPVADSVIFATPSRRRLLRMIPAATTFVASSTISSRQRAAKEFVYAYEYCQDEDKEDLRSATRPSTSSATGTNPMRSIPKRIPRCPWRIVFIKLISNILNIIVIDGCGIEFRDIKKSIKERCFHARHNHIRQEEGECTTRPNTASAMTTGVCFSRARRNFPSGQGFDVVVVAAKISGAELGAWTKVSVRVDYRGLNDVTFRTRCPWAPAFESRRRSIPSSRAPLFSKVNVIVAYRPERDMKDRKSNCTERPVDDTTRRPIFTRYATPALRGPGLAHDAARCGAFSTWPTDWTQSGFPRPAAHPQGPGSWQLFELLRSQLHPAPGQQTCLAFLVQLLLRKAQGHGSCSNCYAFMEREHGETGHRCEEEEAQS